MDRREVLRLTALATGFAVGAPLLSSIMSGCAEGSVSAAGEYTPQLLTTKEFEFFKILADTILPETDTPSASQVGVPERIDNMVAAVYKQDDREDYHEKVRGLIAHLDAQSGSDSFVKMDVESKVRLLSTLESNGEEEYQDQRDALKDIKQQVIAMFLSSEVIAENHLNYLPVPGSYEPCIPVADTGNKLWAI